MSTTPPSPLSKEQAKDLASLFPSPRRQLPATTIVLAVVIGLALAMIGYAVGREQTRVSGSTVSGDAYVGVGEFSAKIDGWAYGLTWSANTLTWVDAQDTMHSGGVPSCLAHPASSVPVTFGWVPASGPDGSSWRQITWVRCGLH